LKVYLYIGDNNKTIHLIARHRKYELLCNDKKKINPHRIARRLQDVFIIAPEPAKKLRCVNCEKKVKLLLKDEKYLLKNV
jgi:hypothetical protein